jgi:hypothetical protein
MRTTVEIPDDLFREVKSRAARNGTTLKAYIIDSLIRQVGRIEPSRRVELPLFGEKSRGTKELSNEEIERVFEDEEVEDARRFS